MTSIAPDTSTSTRAMGVVSYDQPVGPVTLDLPAPGPDEVAIAVSFCGVCGTDVKISEGRMGFSADLPLPHVPGHEIVGVVAEAGADARLAVGTRVLVYDYLACGVCEPCLHGRENLCTDLGLRVGFTSQGGFAERIVLPQRLVVPLPDSVSDEAASALGCAMATGYRTVVVRGGVRAGDRVLVIGAGGVGIHAVQIALAAGASVVAADLSPDALAVAAELGAETIDGADLAGNAAGYAPFDVAVETSGHVTELGPLAGVLRPGGRIVLVGYESSAPAQVPLIDLVMQEIEIVGSRYATRSDLLGGLDLVGRGLVTPVISRVLDLDDAAAALAAVKAGAVTGRISLRVAATDQQHEQDEQDR
ncbi:alcohol dehydrogenase catalytic domain-containing protein [Enemella evansiae]|uniref:alcohol dehydrogenase catalytic domain-containing protein n=1 Tax=Enemella evansiae TaxID=2016499 RepID=UPI000B966244|nr:alcohol dehydrogenase catalytic domain-containing protein [Enemella evansiae]OYO05974.1 hypothetical protein CGZ97_04720 [Enemella evansiae]